MISFGEYIPEPQRLKLSYVHPDRNVVVRKLVRKETIQFED
jgi:hypothetical protein